MAEIETAILQRFSPHSGRFKSNILDELHCFGRSRVSKAMADMQKRGLLYYAEGHGFWCLARKVEAGE